jgi:hypothetical protein
MPNPNNTGNTSPLNGVVCTSTFYGNATITWTNIDNLRNVENGAPTNSTGSGTWTQTITRDQENASRYYNVWINREDIPQNKPVKPKKEYGIVKFCRENYK